MIEINLLRRERVRRRPTRGLPKVKIPLNMGVFVSIALVVFLILVSAIIHIYQRGQIADLSRRISQATEEKAKLQDAVRLVNELAQKQKELAVKLGVIQQLDSDRFFEARLLSEINAALPDYLWLIAIKETPPVITIEGMAFSNFLVANFMEELSRSPYFQNVDLVGIEKSESDGKEVARFSIVATLVHFQSPSPSGR